MRSRQLLTPGLLYEAGRIARAYVTFSGGDGAILQSHGVTSVAHDATGHYTVGLCAPIPSASGYGIFGHGSLRTDDSITNGQLGVLQGTSPAVGSVQIDTVNNSTNAAFDFSFAGIAVFSGDIPNHETLSMARRPHRKQLITTWGLIEGGASPALTRGKNISSITDNGAGDYLANFITPYSATTYLTMCAGRQAAAIPTVSIKPDTFSTGSVEFRVSDVNNTAVDTPMYLACLGE